MPQPVQFIRKTSLATTEYQTNFTITDNEILDTITSDEALKITKLMPSIYLRLRRAPTDFWEREGVLRFVGSMDEKKPLSAWEQMRKITGVANSTLSKCLTWLHDRGIIGYSAHKNGIGIRIFFNRAVSSIRTRESQKNLRLVPTPSSNFATPSSGVPFKEENSKKNLDNTYDSAPPRGEQVGIVSVTLEPGAPIIPPVSLPRLQLLSSPSARSEEVIPFLNQAIKEFKCEVSNIVKKEIRATQDWFYDKALPKAIRVAQRETFNLLRNMRVQEIKQSSDVGKNVATEGKGNPHEALAHTLVELGRTTKNLAATSESTPMQLVLQHVSFELDELGRNFYIGKINFQKVEESLDKLEDSIAAALWVNTETVQQENLLRKGEKELQKHQNRMEIIEYRQLVQKHANYALFEHHRIPRLKLFYL